MLVDKRFFNILVSILMVFMIVSCAHYKSGRYIELNKNQSAKSLSNEYQVPEWAIVDANPGKNFQSGDWIFIPLRAGIMGHRQFEIPRDPNARTLFEQEIYGNGRFLWPVPASRKISSGFGHRWGREHQGIDIPASRGSHVLVADDGVVIYSGDELGGYGNLTVVSHGQGLFTVYAHTRKNFTVKGQRVHRGQVIATVGSTGRSTGPHLHFEIRYSGRAVNPDGHLAYR